MALSMSVEPVTVMRILFLKGFSPLTSKTFQLGKAILNETSGTETSAEFWSFGATVPPNRIIQFRCDFQILRGDIMPRGDFNVHFASRGGGLYVRAEEAAGIALLVIILAALLIIGCWYYRRRSGYKMIRTQNPGQSWRAVVNSGQYRDGGEVAENKVALSEFSNLHHVVPNAPPAYEKISSGPLPPPYSP